MSRTRSRLSGFAMAAAACLGIAALPASAHDRGGVNWSVAVGSPAPRAVYVAPPPVMYGPPETVVVAPPVYLPPARVVTYGPVYHRPQYVEEVRIVRPPHYYRHHHHHHRHHGWHGGHR